MKYKSLNPEAVRNEITKDQVIIALMAGGGVAMISPTENRAVL